MFFSRRSLLASLPALALAGCGFFPVSLRYRMTIVVETPEGERSGSGVVEVSIAVNGIDTPYSMGLKGEAVVVDLGQRGLLFAILRGANGGYGYWEKLPEDVIAPALGVYPHVTRDDADRLGVFRQLLALPRGKKVDLKSDQLPMLVRFRDIADPKTVEQVSPNALETIFGAAIKLVRVTVEISDEPVATGVEKVRPSYRNQPDWLVWFQALPYGDVRAIGPEDFRQGFNEGF